MNLPRAVRLVAAGKTAGNAIMIRAVAVRARQIAFTLCAMLRGVTVVDDKRSRASAPAFRNCARAYRTQQLVPGKHGNEHLRAADDGRRISLARRMRICSPARRVAVMLVCGAGSDTRFQAWSGITLSAAHPAKRDLRRRRTRSPSRADTIAPSAFRFQNLRHFAARTRRNDAQTDPVRRPCAESSRRRCPKRILMTAAPAHDGPRVRRE